MFYTILSRITAGILLASASVYLIAVALASDSLTDMVYALAVVTVVMMGSAIIINIGKKQDKQREKEAKD